MIIQGRTFEIATVTTIEQDAFAMRRLRTMGLMEMVATFDPLKSNINAFSEKLLLEAFESGLLFEVLGAILVEQSVPWTKESGIANATFFRTLTNPDDKSVLYDGIGQILADFLISAARMLRIGSPNSSGSQARGSDTEKSRTEESKPLTMVTGASSYGKSPDSMSTVTGE